MEYFCNFIWEQGQREMNEDSLCLQQNIKNNTCYMIGAVCDGIGGLSQGEDASSYMVNSMRELFNDLIKRNKSFSDRSIRNMVCRKIYQCHRSLQNYGSEHGIQLGTTLSMVILIGKKGAIFHVGDSAVFYGKRKLKRLTPIQHSDSGALLQAIGTGKNCRVFFRRIHIQKGSVLLIASDGFYKRIEKDIRSKDWIRNITYDEKDIGRFLHCTKEKVQELGEKDNISAVCIKVR